MMYYFCLNISPLSQGPAVAVAAALPGSPVWPSSREPWPRSAAALPAPGSPTGPRHGAAWRSRSRGTDDIPCRYRMI